MVSQESGSALLKRRMLHALLYEIGALVILVPFMSHVLQVETMHFGMLAVALSLCAMACNMAYNHLFEWGEKRLGWRRTLSVRIAHTLGFELSFLAVALPLTAWWMHISLWDALAMDLALTIGYLVYSFFFNWLYDALRKRC